MSIIAADTIKSRVAGAAVTTTGGLNVGGATTVAGAVVATSFAGDGSSITALSGSNISSGTVAAARVATLNQNTSGTAAGLTGTPNITVGNITGVAATFTGVLTYEDVTNVDSVGIVTARSGIEFGAAGVGGTVSALGHAEFVGIVTAAQFIPTDGQIANRNMVINGDMQVSQRGTSVTSLTASAYATVDRFKFIGSNGGTYTCETVSDSVDNGLRKAFKFTCTTPDNAGQNNLANADGLIGCEYRFEGQDVQRIQKGFSSAKQVTLSFWVKSNLTGTYNVELKDVDNSRNCGFTYTVSSSATWEKKTITYPADTTGTMGNDNGESLTIQWWLAAGNNYRTGASAQTTWASTTTNKRAYNNVSLSKATSNYWEITGVQLEVGPVATPFEFKSYGEQLARCMRYFQIFGGDVAYTPFGTGVWKSSTAASCNLPLITQMRAAPTLVVANPGEGNIRSGGSNRDTTSVALDIASPQVIMYNANDSGGGGTNGHGATHFGANNTDQTLSLSSEL